MFAERCSSFLLIFLILFTTVIGQSPEGRRHDNFDGDWKFHPGDANDPHRDFEYSIANILAKTGEAANTCIRADFDDRSWEHVRLPQDWAVPGSTGVVFTAIGEDLQPATIKTPLDPVK